MQKVLIQKQYAETTQKQYAHYAKSVDTKTICKNNAKTTQKVLIQKQYAKTTQKQYAETVDTKTICKNNAKTICRNC